MADVILEGVTKTFGGVTAVEDLDIEIADGALVVLLGPTGAGKTTTLRLAAGLERPDAGRVLIAGQDVTGELPAARDVSFVFQQYSLYPHYTVYENLAFPLRAPARRMAAKDIDSRVREIAALLRIDSKLENKATQLSGGEMQRVAIGRALVRTPAVFLMDEPLSSLDAKLREDLRIELKRIQRDLGATILYVTHDQLEAMTLADKIGVLSEGRLVQLGSPRDVYERPANVYVARRLGSPQINVLSSAVLPGLHPPPAAHQAGIRPEDLVLGQTGASASVLAVENLGVETIALLELGEGQRAHALLSANQTVSAGDSVRVTARAEAVLYFDAAGARVNA